MFILSNLYNGLMIHHRIYNKLILQTKHPRNKRHAFSGKRRSHLMLS
jgi:hypothetical protein